MQLKGDVKRLGVFVFYDKHAIVDDYVIYLLDSLKDATNDIIIVSNSYLTPESKKIFKKYSNKVLQRDNVGLDAGAFKDAYDEYSSYFKKFDELILMNDTFFGPFEPFKNICEKMKKKKVDFWGLSANYDSVDGYGDLPDGIIHAHIQSFFIVFRKNVLESDIFNDYWRNYNIKTMLSFSDVVKKHELAFTYYLEKNGFKWDVYTDLSRYNSENIDENFNSYAYSSFPMISELNCPFLKRKNLVFEKTDALFLEDGADARRSLDYIKNNNLYDTDMIWKNICRVYSPKEIYYGLNLNYVVDESINNKLSVNYCLLFYLTDEKKVYNFINWFKINKDINYKVFSDNTKIKDILEENNIELSLRSKFEKSDYDYLCLINDKYDLTQMIPSVFENNFLNMKINAFNSSNYINSLLSIMENNKYIDLLLIPENYHSQYFKECITKSKFVCNQNICWVRSSLFKWDTFRNGLYIDELIDLCDENEKLFAKVRNFEDLHNSITTMEYIIKDIYKKIDQCGCGYSTFIESMNNISNHLNSNTKKSLVKRILRKIKKMLK